ncbi:MAG: hypothetical protein FWG23_04570 [Eggerthellaceae bacterium]|jgi:ferredoxin-thioredoxin reductase catalytic subunit|nr:hypothetical protein [Eggerthellaceae bacterium]MDR2716191.1 hypothetical protein [Coriobacteriaceae bacterium]
MKGYRINPDSDYVMGIIRGISKRNGHCPCRVNIDDTSLCPCDEFVSEGICKCDLFIPVDETAAEGGA